MQKIILLFLLVIAAPIKSMNPKDYSAENQDAVYGADYAIMRGSLRSLLKVDPKEFPLEAEQNALAVNEIERLLKGDIPHPLRYLTATLLEQWGWVTIFRKNNDFSLKDVKIPDELRQIYQQGETKKTADAMRASSR